VKDLGKLTGISVQTLHHYDRIDLLTPSLRQPNGYRVYSENDLLRLQQILALKFFGFELEQIKGLLTGKVDMRDHFAMQAQFLNEKAQTLITATNTLQSILSECDQDKSIPWETIIQLIEVFKMTQELEKSWAANVFTPEELKQYARFESGLKDRFTPEDKISFDAQWAQLIQEIKLNLDTDPKSEIGINLAKKVMDLVNLLYGKEHANLKHQIWVKGFKQGKMQEDHLFTPEIIAWVDKANDAYYRGRIYNILDQVGSADNKSIQTKWNDLMEEMYGNSKELKQAIIDAAMTDEKVSDAARKWLKQFCQ
jgi:DNA-binding transcriptional MerR regulator